MEDKKDYIVENMVFNSKPEKIIPLNQLSQDIVYLINKAKLLNSTETINKLRGFKDYFCKHKCKYHGIGTVIIPIKMNNESTFENFPICRYCRLNDFIKEFMN